MILKIIEVHNVYTVYGLDSDGEEVEQPITQFSRPQDWGNPKWYYERFRFERVIGETHYINHTHCWTDLQLKQYEYPALFAPLIVMILMPSRNPKLCGRKYLAEDDFWEKSWGDIPPYFLESGEDEMELDQ